MWVIAVFILIVFAVAFTPAHISAVQTAQASWPEGSLMLSLIPSPIEVALAALVVILVSLAFYVVTQQ